MGMWVTVKLAFGFDLGQGIPDFLIVDEDVDNDGDVANFWADWAVFQKGVKKPDLKYEESPEEYQRILHEFGQENPFEILTYHSYSERYARYFLALSESVQSGGSNKPMTPNIYDINPQVFKDFCEKYNVPYQEPKWQIVSLYG